MQPSTLENLLPWVDTFLVDLKLIDPGQHQQWTGAPLEPILDNLDWLAGELQLYTGTKRLWIRSPLIPGATFSRENLIGISAYLAGHVNDAVERWELCAFNNLCRDKYARLDLDWKFQSTLLMSPSELDQAKAWANLGGFDPQRTFVTGAARLEEN
jgi:pyruvate formate lyase activating enzyme